jgi:FkbH-like protein/FkbM family methyltransferase
MVPSLQHPRNVRPQGAPSSRDFSCVRTEKISLGSLPYLADHAFQSLIVLPGSFCIETALRLHCDALKRDAGALRNIEFRQPVILSDQDCVIRIEVREKGTGVVEYQFSEAANEDCFARLEIADAEPRKTESPAFSITESRAGSFTEGKEFYERLRQNGNEYGPRFQNLLAIWRQGDRAWGRLLLSQNDCGSTRNLDLTLLDSFTHLLAACVIEKNRAVALKAIDRIQIWNTNFPETLWARARLSIGAPNEAEGFNGDIEVFDEFGNCYLEFRGVAFSYLTAVDATEPREKLKLCIAASFTADPVEDSLKFWADRFGLSADIQFGPYNQIFQQLLDKGSAFRKNDDGINIVLLNLEDWIAEDEPTQLKVDREQLDKRFGKRLRCVLPNKLEIVHLQQYETDYLYQEIFRDECYFRHGIQISDGDTVVDIGANIGLFSLFVLNRCQNARIYAFEPSPVVCELLKANCEAYGQNVHVFQCGVSDKPKSAEFTFYDSSSVFSGFHANATEDKQAIAAIVGNILSGEIGRNASQGLVEELTAERLHRQTFQCRLTSLSEIIRQNQIERIHLLKIDAERSELDIVQGIEDEHWPLIDQLVIEVHDRKTETARQIERFLIGKGFRCAIEQEKLLENSGLFNIYATRFEKTQPSTASWPRGIGRSLKRNSDEFLSALSSFATECDRPILLCFCPPSPDSLGKTELNQLLRATEQKLLESTSKLSNVRGISSATTLDRCQSQNYHDSHGRQLGHVSYNCEGYAAIGTILFENIFRLRTKPFKVLILDCDDTLWQGACGEDGPLGVEITEGHRALHQFVVKQVNAGVLVCLCSKNNEKDVFEVFAQNQKMILKREHLAECQINWNNKSDNIKTLATKLNVGLDSILFLDDNPVECAEVKINCPEVLTLQLPGKGEDISRFLDGIWPLPGNPLTSEDQKRTRMYQQNAKREQYRKQAFTLKDFLDGLQLRIAVTNPTNEQISRVSQLTWRTNQFNFTTIRRSEAEIQNWLAYENRGCLAATVSDRFGDYGLVGVLLYEIGIDRITVDTFLLSCRALGRGVEHRMLAELARIAQREEKEFVEINYLPTEKNAPALEFIKNLTSNYPGNAASSFTFSTKELASLEYQPVKKAAACAERKTAAEKHLARSAQTFREFDRSATFQNICNELTSVAAIAKAVDDFMGRGKGPTLSGGLGPAETLEATLAYFWARVLGKSQIGLNENFFEAGGTSLKAVQLLALIQREFKRSLPITSLFECPSIGLFAARMKAPAHARKTNAVAALRRGQQRRYGKRTRKAA